VFKFLADLLKSPWFLASLGVVVFIWAALPKTTVIAGESIGGLDGTYWRIAAAALGIALIAVGLMFAAGWIGSRSEGRLPVERIDITESLASVSPRQVRLSGVVAPTKAGVNVWFLRQDLGARGAGYSLAPGPVTTTQDGTWQHTIHLWGSGPFIVFAVVATKEQEKLFHYYRDTFEQMLGLYQREVDSKATNVPGWPKLDEVPTACSASREVQLT
jgi:hypothetical protein